MGQKLGCGDRDVGVGSIAHALKGAFTNEAAEDDAADELSSGSRRSTRSKKFGRHSSLRKPSKRKLSIGSSFVGGGDVLRPRQKNKLELQQQNKLLKQQLKLKKAKAKKATTAEMA